jgi:hypothetical protein
MFGLTYLQQVTDSSLHAGRHIEPGLWVTIPATSNPKEGRRPGLQRTGATTSCRTPAP